jgi:hypothetical protein
MQANLKRRIEKRFSKNRRYESMRFAFILWALTGRIRHCLRPLKFFPSKNLSWLFEWISDSMNLLKPLYFARVKKELIIQR